MHEVLDFFSNKPDLTYTGILLRAGVVYLLGLIIIRLGSRRSFSQFSAVDVVLGIIIGSTLSRAINGTAPLVPTLLSVALLVGLHRLITHLCIYSPALENLVKGKTFKLVNQGKLNRKAMHKNNITENDMEEGLRLKQLKEWHDVEEAYLERDGTISFIPKKNNSN